MGRHTRGARGGGGNGGGGGGGDEPRRVGAREEGRKKGVFKVGAEQQRPARFLKLLFFSILDFGFWIGADHN